MPRSSHAKHFNHILCTATNLTSLHVADIQPTEPSVSGITLTSLQRLTCTWSITVPPLQVVTYLSRCLLLFPRLESLTIEFNFGELESEVARLCEFMKEAERHGVREIFLIGSSGDAASLMQGLSWLRLFVIGD